MTTKLSQLQAAMAAGDTHAALRIAARFTKLGDHKEPITRAWAAVQNPDFYRDLGKDPAALVAAGVDAIRSRYQLQ